MSAKSCTACRHPLRAQLDEAIVAGETSRPLAKRISALAPDVKPLSHDAVNRHRRHVGQAISKALARKEDAPPDALALADKLEARAADTVALEESILAKVTRLETDARRIGERAEKEGDLRAALVANKGLLDIIRQLHEMTPPKTSEADAMRVVEWMAEETGASPDEIIAQCEKLKAIQDAILRGENPPHTHRVGASDIGSPNFDLKYTIKAAADAARLPGPSTPAAPPPPIASPVIIPGVPPPLPSAGEEPEPSPALLYGHRPWSVVV